MSDDDFDDLLDGVDVLHDSSQESLTKAAANLDFVESDVQPALARSDGLLDVVKRNGRRAEEALTHHPDAETVLQYARPEDQGRQRPSNLTRFSSNATRTSLDVLTARSKDQPRLTGPGPSVVQRIESVFEEIADSLLSEKDRLSITLKTRPKESTHQLVTSNRVVKERRICFPGKTAEEAWRFSTCDSNSSLGLTDIHSAVVTRILQLIHQGLRDNVTLSKRYRAGRHRKLESPY